jgi:hypothetical protein
MSILKHGKLVAALAFAAALADVGTAHAQRVPPTDVDSLDQMIGEVMKNMPEFLKGDNVALVENMMAVKLADPLSRTFDPNFAIKELFGDDPVFISLDCRRRGTPVGEPDQGDCVASNGQERGRGKYTQLSYSKNMGKGDIKFLKRGPVDDNLTPEKLPTAKLSDQEAEAKALEFLGKLGLPTQEIPAPTNGNRNIVRSFAIGGADDENRVQIEPIIVQKHVLLRRGLPLGQAIPVGNQFLTHLPLPGQAMVAVDDTGVVAGLVSDWQELRKPDTAVTEDKAKSGDDLAREIAQDLFNDGIRRIGSMRFNIVLSSEWRGTFGVMLPAVQVGLSPVPPDDPGKPPSEEQQNALALTSTGAILKEYSLVERADVKEVQGRTP